MVPDQCLPYRRQLLEDLVVKIGKADLAARAKDTVLDDETIKLVLSRLRQCVPSGAQIGELGLAVAHRASRRDFACRQQRALRWDVFERTVGVPQLVAEIEQVAAI